MTQTANISDLRALLDYCPETGKFKWKERAPEMFGGNSGVYKTWTSRHVGKPALTNKISAGYLSGRVMNKPVLAHRVAWAITHGEWPAGDIDHINGDKTDNRIENLRVVSKQENQRNLKLYSTNSSGSRGVYWHRGQKKWIASIKVSCRLIHLGTFEEMQAAIDARIAAEAEYGFHQNHGRKACAPKS